ncbi:nucleolar pre-ribosomal-associated protein 1 isoform X1 [Temnothorax longispinosus]|uniref:nucleolar pre-ribosomal-associated protein 1 isoform X1 n=1 Tax=Temnothorax longispinosus TaxID=300112 RepID=UPI003A9A1558
MRMDSASKPKKKARKRTSRNEDETSTKKAKINGSLEEVPEPERDVARENVYSDKNDAKDEAACNDRQDIFNGQSLRTLFSTSADLTVLRKFVTICNENKERDLAAEYLLAGGSVLEVLRLLESSDKKSTANATIVFSAIHILLIRILTECPQHHSSAIEACRHLLNSYMSVVHSMLSTQSSKQRKVVLRLLAAIASLDSSLSKELLIHLSLQQQTLESLAQHTKPTDSQSVRTCFIHFVLAFLVEGNTLVIRTLLDKRNMLCCIFSDLLYDTKEVVTLVLTTVKTYVLENTGVSKTTKMHVFSIPAVLNLISLYNWKGPNNWPKNKTHTFDESENFRADKEVVSDIVHEFLITLLTSHRYGVIFHDRTLGGSRNKHNQLVHTVLQNLEKPWEHEKPSDLIVRIMGACPDLIRSQYNAIKPFLEPRVSPKWNCLLKFIGKIVKSVDPVSCIKTCAAELKANNLISALLSLAVPSTIVKVAILPGLDHDSLSVRHEALSLLLIIANQLKAISLAAKEFYKTSIVQNQITDFILRTIPTLETILRMWNRAFENDTNIKASENAESIQDPELVDHLDVILSVLHLYQDICPELLDISTNLQPSLLLSNLNSLQDDGDDGEITKIEKVNCMKVKTIQFLLALDSSIFAPKEKAFKEALVFLISLIRQKDPSPDSYNATRKLLNATGLFETCEDQLDIWINGFSVVADSKENEQLTQWFMSVLKSAIKHIDKYINIITQAEGVINDQISNLNVKTAEDIINELFDKTDKISLCQEELSTVGLSLINGKFSFDEKKDDTIDDSFYKFKQENSKDTKLVKCVTQRNEQVTNFDTKEIEDAINRLLDKVNLKNFPFNKGQPNKISSTIISPSMNEFTNSDIKKTNEVIGTLFNNFGKEKREHCRMQACTAVSPLLCCALQKINEKNCTPTILAYLSYVTVHTLHCQVVPDLLVYMATDLINLPVYKYLQSWSSNKQPISLKDKLPSLRLLHKLSSILLADSKMDLIEFSKLFNDGHSTYCFKYNGKEVTIKYSLSLYDVKTLLKMTVFYLAQLAQSKILRQTQNENCKLMLAFLLSIRQSDELNQNNVATLEENARCIFTHPILLHYFSPFCEETSKDSMEYMITETILKVCESVLNLYKYNDAGIYIFFAFKDKFLTQLRNIIERNPLKACSNNYDIAIDLLKILQLGTMDIASLLCALMKLQKIVFISSDKENLSIFGHVVPVLLDMYCSKESRLRDTMNEQFVEKFSLHLVYLKSSKINHVERWEQALAKYLSISPHNVSGVSTNTFALLLTKSINASTIQLITTLITKNTRLIPSLVKYFLKENVKQDIVFPILNSNLKYKWNEKFLQSLRERYGSDIAAYMTEPQNPVSWIEENAAAIVYLIESTFDLVLCEKICNNISQNGDKLDMVSVCFVQLLESVYKKYESLITAKEKSLMDLIKVLLHIMTSTLKKESKNMEKIKVLCEKLNSAVIRLKKTEDNFVFSSLSKSYSWPQFTRFSLKLGLKDAKDEETQSNVLKTLSNLCDIAYGDNVDDEYMKTLFEMTTSHSEFVNIMLGSSAVKGDLVELLRILTRKNHSVMTASHVPLYLAAYNATLCHVDQRILQILQYYETHNVKLQQYWPYLWGSAAATRYSVKGETDTALWRQPSTSEIFNLFNKDIVNETIKNYPIHRAIKSDELHENSNVYDPAFYLPLLCTLLAENNIVACHKISQSGALALVLATCCSDSSDIRMTAYTIISRYYFHLEASKSKEKLLWMRLIDAMRNGIASLNCPLKDVRLSCLMTTFLARASLIASQPLHPLYSPLHTFLMAKTALDLNTIPELLQLLHSSHVEHNAHRHWILENIRDGMKEENDVNVALKCVLFKILLDFHTCALSDTKTKKLILEVVASTTRIPKASLLLTRGYGMLPWLHEIVNHLDICEAEIRIIITIIENLLNTLDNSAQDISHYKTLLFSILLLLRVHSKNRDKVRASYIFLK